MTDRGLVNEKRVGDQNAAGPECALEFRKQRAVEEIYIHDGVERFVREMKAIQVCDHGPDGESIGSCSRGERLHCFGGEINRNHSHANSRERECVAPATGGDVEDDAARDSREHRGKERLGFARCLAAMVLLMVLLHYIPRADSRTSRARL
jgi:hypothetical protein